MTESQFIEENKKKWQELEYLLSQKERDPDRLHELFVKVSSDLAYASTFYPKRSVRAYLNQLTQQVFDSMEKKKSEWSMKPIREFVSTVMPRELYRSRKVLLFSFIIFTVAVLIGVVSSANNPDFVRVILGDRYVDMTESNINSGDPMAVYKDMEQGEMFFMITFNNVKVSFFAFIFGIFGSLATIILLLSNGIMVGSFQYFFYEKGLFFESFLTIWIHGTIEISAIIIAGAAGIVLGNGLLFPDTYDRGTSLQMASKRAVRIVISTVPLFIIAGFLESFVTRLTEMPTVVKILIIGVSLLLILGFYVVYPWYHHKYIDDGDEEEDLPPEKEEFVEFEKMKKRTFAEDVSLGFSQFRVYMGTYFKHGVSFLLPLLIVGLVVFMKYLLGRFYFDDIDHILLTFEGGGFFMYGLLLLVVTYAMLMICNIYDQNPLNGLDKMITLKRSFIPMAILLAIPLAMGYFLSSVFVLVLLLIVPAQFWAVMSHAISTDGWSAYKRIVEIYKKSFYSWGTSLVALVLVLLIHGIVILFFSTAFGQYIFDFISWHDIFGGDFVSHYFVMTIAYVFTFLLFLPLYFYLLMGMYNTSVTGKLAIDLNERFQLFGQKKSMLES